jgi:sugar-specific transcriptional regulator TrmB
MPHIYKIVSPHTDKIYIGKTSRNLQKRFSEHIKSFEQKKDNMTSSSEVLQFGDCEIISLVECPKNCLDFLEFRYILKYSSQCVNKIKTKEEEQKFFKKWYARRGRKT